MAARLDAAGSRLRRGESHGFAQRRQARRPAPQNAGKLTALCRGGRLNGCTRPGGCVKSPASEARQELGGPCRCPRPPVTYTGSSFRHPRLPPAAHPAIPRPMLLYDHPLSSYAQKVKIALREKHLPFTTQLPPEFGTGNPNSPLAAANPRAEIPVLIDGPTTIFDSTIILEYLEDRFPTPALLPATPEARAAARTTEDICDTHYEAVNWGVGEIRWFNRATGALAETLRQAAARDTATIQAWLAARLADAPWFNGETFGWADAAVAPMLNRSIHYGLGPPPGSPLAHWHARLIARPAVAETFAEFDAAAARMAAAANLYTTGGRRREYRDHRLEWMIRSGGLAVVQAGLEANTISFPWLNE